MAGNGRKYTNEGNRRDGDGVRVFPTIPCHGIVISRRQQYWSHHSGS
ncbi:uncharacterized protein G2W53_001047 [Senna tora]|uniref:Uncharacterized protein n=1 Tax=Senna tora TaxID=362788 RepID=A0A835CM78_9FABA|nr:uncharacterized protein G2W53_001047 [Senna tora]